jgi:predicted O-methyltransferase YrrM
VFNTSLLIRYITYLLKANNRHITNSPFINELLNQVFYVDAEYYAYKKIEKLREALLDSNEYIKYNDMGAKATGETSSLVKVAAMAQQVLKKPKHAQLLFRLVNYFQPKSILELGTSFGISTLYMASAKKNAKVVTIEGCENVASIAKLNFEKAGVRNIQLINDSFNNALPKIVESNTKFDFVFVDGNHKKESTLKYFEQILEKTDENSVIVFDDINWSEGMNEAWEKIKSHKSVTVSIDIFNMGFVFFKKNQAKQHFVIKY